MGRREQREWGGGSRGSGEEGAERVGGREQREWGGGSRGSGEEGVEGVGRREWRGGSRGSGEEGAEWGGGMNITVHTSIPPHIQSAEISTCITYTCTPC